MCDCKLNCGCLHVLCVNRMCFCVCEHMRGDQHACMDRKTWQSIQCTGSVCSCTAASAARQRFSYPRLRDAYPCRKRAPSRQQCRSSAHCCYAAVRATAACSGGAQPCKEHARAIRIGRLLRTCVDVCVVEYAVHLQSLVVKVQDKIPLENKIPRKKTPPVLHRTCQMTAQFHPLVSTTCKCCSLPCNDTSAAMYKAS